MRALPEDDDDRARLARLNVEPWMIEHLKLNPEYVHWGPGEDYMSTKGESWAASQEVTGWSAFGPWALDELNECVHFYFELERPSEECAACAASGYNAKTKVIADTFYDHGDYSIDFTHWRIVGSIEDARKLGGATGRRWHDKITQDEVDALVAAGRLRKWTESGWQTVPRTAAEVNAANAEGAKHHHELDHDGINRGILIEARAKRLGVWGLCPSCEGHGTVFTTPHGHLNVVLWVLHPRKGCSRGVRVRHLSEVDAEAVKRWLAQAADRNAQRFGKITRAYEASP
jgi:hypothetical protein